MTLSLIRNVWSFQHIKIPLRSSLSSCAFITSSSSSSSLPSPHNNHRCNYYSHQLFSSSAVSASSSEIDPGVVEGTQLRIVKYPHPSLRAHNDLIREEELESGSISKIAKEMFLVMYAAEGIGLAAPQVGVNKRLMVYNESGDKKKWLMESVLVNPKIVEYSEAVDIMGEGCLSFPDMDGEVQRSKWVKIEALSLKGKKIKKKFKGFEARLFQHEYDHLDGKVYIDHLSREGRATVQPTLDTLIEEYDVNDGDAAL